MSLAAPAVAIAANQSKTVGHTAPLLPTPPTLTNSAGLAGIAPGVPAPAAPAAAATNVSVMQGLTFVYFDCVYWRISPVDVIWGGKSLCYP